MAETKIKFCKCKHSYQDSTYGRGKRLHNQRTKREKNKNIPLGWQCTVCGDVKTD